MTADKKPPYIRLTSHPRENPSHIPIHWGEKTPQKRGPIIASFSHPKQRNVIGAHSGSYAVYRALSIAAGHLDPTHIPDLTNTTPVSQIGPHPQWFEKNKIVSLDPFGATVGSDFQNLLKDGYDIRPTIAITQANLNLPELEYTVKHNNIKPDGVIVKENGSVSVTKIALEPVWHLPGVAERFDVDEFELRRVLYEQTGGMFTELVTRPDLNIFLPPIGGITAYIFGDVSKISDPKTKIACRVHDECNGSDVFGSDICTCRPYLVHGVEVCIENAQKGGVGILIYFRKEGRALGEVTKFLVYNARKRNQKGDTAADYFERTECVAGVQDARFQELMPDVLNWMGIKKIDKFVSMSDMKHDSIVKQGIEIKERIPIPEDRIPEDAHVEIEAKKASGYFTKEQKKIDLDSVKGRDLDE